MPVRRAVWALMVAAVAAACTSTSAPVHGTAPTPATGSRSATHSAEWKAPPDTKPESQQVSYALVAADGRRVTVSASGGGCTEDAHLTASETPDDVILHLDGYVRQGNVVCPANLIIWTRSVSLTSPLGARRLLDGSRDVRVPYFDGRQLAMPGWLPPGAHGPFDRPDRHGWSRTYTFDAPRTAPIEIDQLHGNTLRKLQPASPEFIRRTVLIHGRPAVLIEQRGPRNGLVQDFLGWSIGGFVYLVESQPERVPQRPFPPAVLLHVARTLTLPDLHAVATTGRG